MAARKSPAPDPPAAPDDGPSFEQGLERLETIVEELEGGALTLEQSIARYEEGMKLSRRLTQTLDQAERRIERLVETEGGSPATEPLELEDEPAGPAAPAAEQRPGDERRSPPPRRPARPQPDELPF